MNRFGFLSLTLATLVALAPTSSGADPPNILLIVSEDNGPELGTYGDPYARTPNLDRLAADGVRFDRAFVAQAGCSPSRASFLTGLYPHQNGQLGLATWGFRMYREDTPNMARSLKEAGYRTGLIGKLHVNPESAFPFDFKAIPTANFQRKNLADYARHAESFFGASDQPFFLSVNYPDAHRPWLRQAEGLPEDPLRCVGRATARLSGPRRSETASAQRQPLQQHGAPRRSGRRPVGGTRSLWQGRQHLGRVLGRPRRGISSGASGPVTKAACAFP